MEFGCYKSFCVCKSNCCSVGIIVVQTIDYSLTAIDQNRSVVSIIDLDSNNTHCTYMFRYYWFDDMDSQASASQCYE